jgi:hypothetical protein
MKELIMVPVVLGLVLTLGMQLSDIADSSAQKTVDFAEDMNNAFDCAARGVSIYECSPDLKTTSFKKEMNETIGALDRFQGQMKNSLNDSLLI